MVPMTTLAGLANGLEVLSPVDDGGLFTDECGVPELVGQHVFKSNERIVEMLTERDALLGSETYEHQYPFCWRSKTPIIFRAVEQFFISLEGIREKAMEEIDQVNWLPHWGRNRIFGTVEARPDWCISRQRTWGFPSRFLWTGWTGAPECGDGSQDCGHRGGKRDECLVRKVG